MNLKWSEVNIMPARIGKHTHTHTCTHKTCRPTLQLLKISFTKIGMTNAIVS